MTNLFKTIVGGVLAVIGLELFIMGFDVLPKDTQAELVGKFIDKFGDEFLRTGRWRDGRKK